MKNTIFTLSIFSFLVTNLHAQNQWAADKIPAELKEKAHAVVRMSETFFTIKNIGEATKNVHYAITILDEQGLENAHVLVFYDKLTKVNDLQGVLYDANGEKVKKLKNDDIKDGSANSEGTLFSDNRYKYGEFKYAIFPFTVEFNYTTTNKNMLFYPSFYPQEDEENMTVESSLFKVKMPAGMELRYKLLNGMSKPNVEDIDGGKTYTWAVKGLKHYENEPYAPLWIQKGMGVLTAPNEFETEGFKGNAKTWKELGDFDNLLAKNRDILPDNVKQEVQQLVAGITDPMLKTKKIYEYLQAKTRYISIQLGIGGWQPFEAKQVAEKGYGDCKALSNYTQAMLKSVGIESHYASIRGGDGQQEVQADFPSQQFNHAMLCVPIKNDTIWLECTSQDNPFGYQGSFTSNRYALLATPTGGKLVRTPVYKPSENQQVRKIEVNLADDGNATAEVLNIFTGPQHDDYASIKSNLNPDDQKKALYKRISIPSFELNNYSIQEEKKRIPSATVKMSLAVRKCASKSGTRMFLSPNLMSAESGIPPTSDKPRIQEVELQSAYTQIDTVIYNLPKDIKIEFKPESITFESKFGSYYADNQVKDGKLLYIRKFVRNRGKFPATSYVELVDFYKKVTKYDKAQVVMKF
jgi:transglutaminase-like putative cysteine protease